MKVQAQVESEALLFIDKELYIGSTEKAYNFDKNGMEKYTEQTDKWEIVGNTLTLNGFSFETTSGLGLVVADGGIIELAAGSVNIINTSGSFEVNSVLRNHQIYGKSFIIQGKGTLNTYGSGDGRDVNGCSIMYNGSLTLRDCTLNVYLLNCKYTYGIYNEKSYGVNPRASIECNNAEINIYTQESSNIEFVAGMENSSGNLYIRYSVVNIVLNCNSNIKVSGVYSIVSMIEGSILNIENSHNMEGKGVFSSSDILIINSHISVLNVRVAFYSIFQISAPLATVTGAKEEFPSGKNNELTPKGEGPVILDNKTFNFNGLTANGVTGKETTTELQLTFDSYVPSLTEANITVTGAKKGALTKVSNRGEYTLAVSDITVEDGESITVDIAVPNLNFVGKEQSVVVYKETPLPVPVNYDMLEGADAQWTKGTKEGIVLKSNGEFDKFKEVRINGNIVGKENYLAQKGSTIITLKPEYLNTLSCGKYLVEMVFSDGSATTSFTVKDVANGDDSEEGVTPGGKDEEIKPGDGTDKDVTPGDDKGKEEKLPPVSQKPETKSPNTGDHTNTSTWILLMVMSGSIIMLSRFAKARSRD